MPTTNPRVNVTLAPSSDALVSRLAELQRVSKSQVLRELLEAAEPALRRAVALMEAAQSANDAVRGRLAKSLDLAIGEAEAALEGALQGVDAASQDLVRFAETVKGRRPASARARAGAPSRASRKTPA